MDLKIMELRLEQWMPIFEEQAKSGLNKQDWCRQNEVKRAGCSLPQSRADGKCVELGDIAPDSIISIRCGEFVVDLKDDVNELLLSKILKVMADVY